MSTKDRTLRNQVIRLAYENPKVRVALKEAGILDKLFKRYKEDHPNSKTPPQSLRDKAKEIEEGKKTEKKDEGWSDVSKLPDTSNVSKMEDKDLAEALKKYEAAESKAKAEYDDITKNSVTSKMKKEDRKDWHKKFKPIHEGLMSLKKEKHDRNMSKGGN